MLNPHKPAPIHLLGLRTVPKTQVYTCSEARNTKIRKQGQYFCTRREPGSVLPRWVCQPGACGGHQNPVLLGRMTAVEYKFKPLTFDLSVMTLMIGRSAIDASAAGLPIPMYSPMARCKRVSRMTTQTWRAMLSGAAADRPRARSRPGATPEPTPAAKARPDHNAAIAPSRTSSNKWRRHSCRPPPSRTRGAATWRSGRARRLG